ncbi:MAG: hypothetical protein IID32_09470 [Planctomycetes bacterium]|nr:hypothetical protein [Planctomycetota bacterium]
MKVVGRISYLLILTLLIGLVLVHLRNVHIQSVNRLTHLWAQEHRLHQGLWEQRAELARVMQSPPRLKEKIAVLGLDLVPPGKDSSSRATERLAKSEDSHETGI